MIIIALGGNLPSPAGPPAATLAAARAAIAAAGVQVLASSRLWAAPAWPPSDQADYVNAAMAVATTLRPVELLELLHGIEAQFGRERRVRNAARTLDLDLVAWGELITGVDERPRLPHPRMAARDWVLRPMADFAADWHHPETGHSIADLIAALPVDPRVHPLPVPIGVAW